MLATGIRCTYNRRINDIDTLIRWLKGKNSD
jgi:hypothetical protein